jgi:hypothetical protein
MFFIIYSLSLVLSPLIKALPHYAEYAASRAMRDEIGELSSSAIIERMKSPGRAM